MGLQDMLNREPVSSLPLRVALTIGGDQSVREAMALMHREQVGCVFLLDEQQKPLQMFSERILLPLLMQAGKLDEPTEAHAIPLKCCVKLSDPINLVIRQMADRDIRFVCVVDEEGKLAGLTGQRGVMEYIAERFPRHVMVQEMESKLHMDQREGA